MLRLLPLGLLVLLAACGTPQERCINTATRELRSVERLLAEVEGNLARGYAWQEYEVTRTRWVRCAPAHRPPAPLPDGSAPPPPRPVMCLDDYTVTMRRRVAIDPVAEQRKRDGLIAKQAQLTRLAKAQIAYCKSTYPE